MAWWVMGEYSRDLEEPFTNHKLPEVCLIAAKELAALTAFVPGPRSAPALLDRVLRLVNPDLPDSVSLEAAVNGAPEDWRKRWLSSSNWQKVDDFCPVHVAAYNSIQDVASMKAANANASIDATPNVSPLDLALQTYQEALLIKVVNDK
jgi:hypothetical protein